MSDSNALELFHPKNGSGRSVVTETSICKEGLSAHWAALGALRFLLAMIVVSAHLGYAGVRDNGWAAILYSFGSAEAVIAFFVLSGYSIAHSISTRPEGYFIRRILRIYPVYILALFIGVVPFIIFGHTIDTAVGSISWSPIWPTVFYNVFLLQFITGATIGLTGVAWSLSVEWVFYCTAPILHQGHRIWILICAAISAVLWLAAPHMGMPWAKPEYWELKDGMPVILVAWSWLVGFAYYRYRNSQPFLSAVAFALFLFLIMTFGSTPVMAGGTRGVALVVGTAILICITCKLRLPAFLVLPMDYLGSISYPLYLTHIATILTVYNYGQSKLAISYVAASVLVAMITFHATEGPTKMLKSYLSNDSTK